MYIETDSENNIKGCQRGEGKWGRDKLGSIELTDTNIHVKLINKAAL